MPKPTKYQKARLRSTDEAGRDVWTEVLPSDVIDDPNRGDLICIGCPVPIRRVRSYSRMKTGTEVPAYLSLYPKTEHATECLLNLDRLQNELRRSYPDTVSIEEKVLYLHLPDEERMMARQRTKEPVRVRSSGDRWTNTMHSAANIVRYLQQFEKPGDILNRIKIKYRDHRGEISEMFWADFCFPARSTEALRYLRRLEWAEETGHAVPPVAVIFPVTKGHTERANSRFIRVDTLQKTTPGNEHHKLYLSLGEMLDPDRQMLKSVPHGTVLALAHGHILNWIIEDNQISEIRLDIEAKWQLARM